MNTNVRFEDWSRGKMEDPEFRAAYEALEPAYQLARLRIRIPQHLLDQLRSGEDAGRTVRQERLATHPSPRMGWDEQFRRMAERGDDRLLDEQTTSLTRWDAEEWEWF